MTYGGDDVARDLRTVRDATPAAAQGPLDRLAAHIERLEALKRAGDDLVLLASRPKRHGTTQLLEAIVEYRRQSEGLDR